MRIDIITIFPEMFHSFIETSLIARGIKKDLLTINLFDLRSVTTDNHKTVDGRPFGGGPGMVLRVDIIDRALETVIKSSPSDTTKRKIILVTPQGRQFKQSIAIDLATVEHLIFICGHYEGFDERIRTLVDEEISLGDFVVTGGEFPTMVMIDAIARFIPDFLGKEHSNMEESFNIIGGRTLLEYPQYTKPIEYNGMKVPDILISGHHARIANWRLAEAIKKTTARRPDLLNSDKSIDKPVKFN